MLPIKEPNLAVVDRLVPALLYVDDLEHFFTACTDPVYAETDRRVIN